MAASFPTVSLLVPCYNAAPYIQRLWQTIEAQTVSFDEIIFYDDASTDITAQLVEDLPKVKLLRGKKNLGPAGARNELLVAATSDYVHFQDADDPMNLDFLEKLKNNLTRKIDVILCDADWFNEHDGSLAISWRYKDDEIQNDPVGYTLTHPISLNNSLIRRDLILKTGGFNTGLRIFEDADMYVRLAAAGARFKVVEEVLTTSIRHARGVSSSLEEITLNRLKALREYASWMGKKYYPLLAQEAERAARKFYQLGDRTGIREALNFCIALGGEPPATDNAVLKALKSVLSYERTFLLQENVRQTFLRRKLILGPPRPSPRA